MYFTSYLQAVIGILDDDALAACGLLHIDQCYRVVVRIRRADDEEACCSTCLSIFSIFRGEDLSGFQQDVLPRQLRLENLTGLPQLLRSRHELCSPPSMKMWYNRARG